MSSCTFHFSSSQSKFSGCALVAATVLLLVAAPAFAAVTTTGSVSPCDPASWTADTDVSAALLAACGLAFAAKRRRRR